MEQLPRVSVGLEAIIGEKWTKDRGCSKRGRQNWARFRDDFHGDQGEKFWKSLLKGQGLLGKGRLFFLFFRRIPPPGPLGRVPRPHRYYQRTPTPRYPSHLARPSLARRYHRLVPLRSPQAGLLSGTWAFSTAAPAPPSLRWKHRGLPGSWATLVDMPRSPTPADRSCQAITAWAMLPSAQSTTSAPQSTPVEALSRGLSTPCVRFAAGVAPGPRNTRFRLVANHYRARTLTCWVTQGGFRQSTSLYMTSSSSRPRLAQTPRSFFERPLPARRHRIPGGAHTWLHRRRGLCVR